MIPNNNLSVFPWYSSIEEQNARKWWAYDRVYPLFTPKGFILPFQILRNHKSSTSISKFEIYTREGELVGDYTNIISPFITIEPFVDLGYDAIIYGGQLPTLPSFNVGQYYAKLTASSETWYSEVFTVTDGNLLKLSWWDIDNMVMDAGIIAYKYADGTQFKNNLYLCADIAKPTYKFTEEGEERNGYFFPIKQISKKVFHINFLASEYLLDVLRFVRMSDFVEIEQGGKRYSIDTFQIDSDWEGDGDIASVDVDFTTATVAKKIGVGYIKSQRGDFNDDFNIDFNNNV